MKRENIIKDNIVGKVKLELSMLDFFDGELDTNTLKREVLEELKRMIDIELEYLRPPENSKIPSEVSIFTDEVTDQTEENTEIRERLITSLVENYLVNGKIVSTTPIPKDILDEVSKRIVAKMNK